MSETICCRPRSARTFSDCKPELWHWAWGLSHGEHARTSLAWPYPLAGRQRIFVMTLREGPRYLRFCPHGVEAATRPDPATRGHVGREK